MTSLRELFESKEESLADCSQRVTTFYHSAKKPVQKAIRKELLDLLYNPEFAERATAVAGDARVPESSETLCEKLRITGMSSLHYNQCLFALGQQQYQPAAGLAEQFMHGKTQAAATVALLMIDPQRAIPSLEHYARANIGEGATLAGIGLLEHYHANGLKGIDAILEAIPEGLVNKIPKIVKLPKELSSYLKRLY